MGSVRELIARFEALSGGAPAALGDPLAAAAPTDALSDPLTVEPPTFDRPELASTWTSPRESLESQRHGERRPSPDRDVDLMRAYMDHQTQLSDMYSASLSPERMALAMQAGMSGEMYEADDFGDLDPDRLAAVLEGAPSDVAGARQVMDLLRMAPGDNTELVFRLTGRWRDDGHADAADVLDRAVSHGEVIPELTTNPDWHDAVRLEHGVGRAQSASADARYQAASAAFAKGEITENEMYAGGYSDQGESLVSTDWDVLGHDPETMARFHTAIEDGEVERFAYGLAAEQGRRPGEVHQALEALVPQVRTAMAEGAASADEFLEADLGRLGASGAPWSEGDDRSVRRRAGLR